MPYGKGYGKKKRMMKGMSYSGAKPMIKGKLGEATKGADAKLKKALMGAEDRLRKKKKKGLY